MLMPEMLICQKNMDHYFLTDIFFQVDVENLR